MAYRLLELRIINIISKSSRVMSFAYWAILHTGLSSTDFKQNTTYGGNRRYS